MAPRSEWIWMDGAFVAWDEAKVHVLTHALHYGTGVFEGVRCYATAAGPAIFRLQDHTERLLASAHALGLEISYTVEDLDAVQCSVVRKNNLETAYIRPLAYFGDEGLGLATKGLQTHVMVAAWPWGAYLGGEALTRGVRVMVSSFTRHHVNSMLCKAKICGNYVNSVLARREAERFGLDEAILLDNQGLVAEGSGENLFLVRQGQLYTPQVVSVLEGLTRASIMTLAEEVLQMPVIEKPITRDELYAADEIFFTGTAAEVTPVCEIDGRQVGAGVVGPITQQLQQYFFAVLAGQHEAYRHWLTPVGAA